MTDFRRALQFVVAAAILQMASCAEFFKPFNVSYDHRALIIGGKRRMLISAGIHYPRATPDMWPDLIAKSKEGGADVIQTYVFWNGHEPVRGQYNFEGRYDLIKFVKLVGSAGLYFHLRIGPYVCAEWNFGGFPLWLRDVPGIQFRTNNEQFKTEMERFVKKIVDLMRQEMLFSWQGGPIILLQIENEYGNIESSYGQSGKEYVKWAAEMALGLGANVPWVMCRQTDAPENIIDACNGFYCDGFKPNSYKKPALWTEDWDGWYTAWGGRVPHRPAEDLAFAVARFFQRGGSFQNYYMYFGGTNFGRTSGGPRYITSYDYDAPIDEYGLLSQPKWGHLKDLHAAIKLCEPALVAVDDAPQYIKLGPMQEAHVYKGSDHIGDFNSRRSGNEICCGFLANIDEHSSTTVEFLGQNYSLPPWSVSILPDCRNVAFNTARVRAQISIKATEVGSPHFLDVVKPEHLLTQKVSSQISKTWFNSKEVIGEWGENSFRAEGILEHLNVTKDTSDYLWYIFRINISAEESSYWETNQVYPKLIIDSIRDVVRIFVNGQLAGSVVGRWVHVEQEVHLVQGYNELAILSETVGLQNYGAFLEKDGAGLRGEVKLSGLKGGELNLSTLLWTYQVGLKGEFRKIYSPEKQESADWSVLQEDSVPYPFTWYKTFFDAPANNRDPVSINLASMGKGQAWVNGHNIGRYWSLVAPKEGCQKTCDYRGAYRTNKCATNCGEVTQSWYHIPRAWLTPSNNLLVIFEETGGNPSEISIQSHSTNLICAQVSEHYYPPLHLWSHPGVLNRSSISSIDPELDLQCDEGQIIATIMFASYGTPAGACQSYSQGNCHAASSVSVVSEACQGRTRCTISVSNKTFGDPCVSVPKRLAVMAECKPPSEIRVGQMSR